MQFNVSSQISYVINGSGTLVLNIGAVDTDFQRVLNEELRIDPFIERDEWTAPSDRNRYFRLNAPTGPLQVSYQATVEVTPHYDEPGAIQEITPAALPLEIVPYLYPSRYCESDRLVRFAQGEFGGLLPGYSRVVAVCNWIYDNVAYLRGSSDEHTSAFDIVTERAGVCRDFAHLGIALCRALQIPARFLTGYAYGLEPPDFHACFEAYLGHRWYVFDATRLAPQNGVVRIGVGRDAADVSFATLFGGVQFQNMTLRMEALGADGHEATAPAPTIEAVALS